MAIIKHKDQRVVVLIDAQNMYHSGRNLYQKRVNFKEILKQAVFGRKLIRAIAYVIKTQTHEEDAFFEALIKSGIETKIKDLQIFAGGFKKADWDVGLAIDAVRLAQSADAVVLTTGDGDFIPLLEYLKTLGRQVELIAFGRSCSLKLKEEADEFFNLEDNPERFLLGFSKKSGSKLNEKGRN